MTNKRLTDVERQILAISTKMNEYLLTNNHLDTLDQKMKLYREIARYLRSASDKMKVCEQRTRKEIIESKFAGRLIDDI